MSLEQALADNTAAIRDLILAISSGHLNLPAAPGKPAPAPAPAAGQPTAKAAAPKKTAGESPLAVPAAAVPAPASTAVAEGNVAAAPSAPEAPAAQPASSVEYPVLQKAVFALAGKSREAAAAVASSFGVKTFKELDAGQWGKALAAVNDKLAELEAA